MLWNWIQLFTSIRIQIRLIYNFDADPNRVSHQSDENLRPWVYRPSTAPFEPSRLHFELHGPPWLHFEPSQLLNFNLDADPDPAFD